MQYYQDSISRLKANGSSQFPDKALRELTIPDRPKPWSINSLKPALTDEALAKELADYFVRITDEFDGLTPNVLEPI